ncbi:acetate/propionate family kinase [Ethanoligenens sp.]|uniref:acetate/propionate family kinase n=1 Tax=Ethanoligenens sp. TaxID=2099655 RepID=UPI0039EB7352
MKILVINAGSSSLKYQLIDMVSKNVLAKGNCERIGIDGRFKHQTGDGRKFEREMPLPDHRVAFKLVIETLTSGEGAVIESIKEISAVGHRVVHGGDKFTQSVLVTDEVLREFQGVINFAPLHNPPALSGIEACRDTLGKEIPNVMVFDTAFHQTMPPHAYTFGVPYKYYEKYRVRRYGAHGTSHRYVSLRCAELLGKKPEDTKIVTCHLGNGSSISAVDAGKCVDTSMGFTPLGGIIMGTRSGDLDPSVVTFIMEKEGISPRDMEQLLNKESGFIGISGISSDDRDLEEATAKGIERSKIAQDAQRYQIKKYVGAYAAAMGGIDALVFTGGIGENSCLLRAAVCENMEYLGIEMDAAKNDTTIRGKEGDISVPGTKTRVYVIPTNEEYMIAVDTKTIVEG